MYFCTVKTSGVFGAASAKKSEICFTESRQKPEIFDTKIAEIAQLVEHDLAKVGVASSSLVFRSPKSRLSSGFFVSERKSRNRMPEWRNR